MNKNLILACALCAGSITNANAVAENMALALAEDGTVDCGQSQKFSNLNSYSIQVWLCPDEWTEGAGVIGAGDAWSLKLGSEGSLVFCAGSETATAASSGLSAGNWFQVTIICDAGQGKIMIDGSERFSGKLAAIPVDTGNLTIGGNYKGKIDEVRLWNDVLTDDFNYFIKNTLNQWCPQRDALAAYYKFDQTGCQEIVEQTAVWDELADNQFNNHGIAKGSVSKVVCDNEAMRYRINAAYTANERFYDRAIPAEQYLLSNELIILGIESLPSGHLRYVSPNSHGTICGKLSHLAQFEGRQGVASFDGEAWFDCGKDLFNLSNISYTFETWFYVEEWAEGASLFEKENADGSKGISLRLGEEERHVMNVSVDGHKYAIMNKVEPGKWNHIAISPLDGAQEGRFTFLFILNGTEVVASRTLSDSEIFNVPTGNEECPLLIGKGFKGKLDETIFFTRGNFDINTIKGHKNNGAPMPGLGITQTADILKEGRGYYRYDKADDLGFNSYSQDSWRNIMLEAYKGYGGYEVRISVKSHDGWESTISSSTKRKIFAADLAALSEGYDGVELDLEWQYGNQTTLGMLAEDIRNALPEGKSFNISCHNVAYGFPKDKMQYVDGFTFQQYGPQPIHSYYSHFEKMCRAFVNHGFPKEKIITSYATTTSRGQQNGTSVTPISGVRNGFLDGDYTPNEEVDFKEMNGITYYFDGPLQTYKRARYSVEQGLGGIFYWDMGNDVPVEHKYNMAKWCSYGLNSNVEKVVDKVSVNHRNSGINEIIADNGTNFVILNKNSELSTNGMAKSIEVCNIAGSVIAQTKGSTMNISSLDNGVYIVVAKSADGTRTTAKIIKQ